MISCFYTVFSVLLFVHLFFWEIVFCLEFPTLRWDSSHPRPPAMQQVTLDSLHEGAANPPFCFRSPSSPVSLSKVLVSHGQPPFEMFVENFRIKQLVMFQLCTVLSKVMKSHICHPTVSQWGTSFFSFNGGHLL